MTDLQHTSSHKRSTNETNEKQSCSIECFYDSQSQTVFLNAVTPWEANRLFSDSIERLKLEDNFFEFWSQEEFDTARIVLFLFTISHVVLISHPNCFFDISYVRFFRNLDILRQKVEPSVSDILRGITGVSKAWASFARPCPPRVLFCFRRPQIRAESIEAKKRDPIHKLERCLEDQIYRILRKSRIVTNSVVNSLFAIPANQEFVYIFTGSEEPMDMGAFLLDQLNDFCKESGYVSDAGSYQSDDNSQERSFYDFLMTHIDLAHEKGFDDSVGRNSVPVVFELPKLKTFVKATEELYKYFMIQGKTDSGMEELKELLNVELEFSERRCAKVYPMALNTYLDGLPQYYTEAQHKSRMSVALQVLKQARGPAQTGAVKKLMDECEAHWIAGHQACETLSLTGNNCVHKRHITVEQRKRDRKSQMTAISHNSKVRFLSTCSCGHRQAVREDPFDVKDANFSFYQHEDFLCCRSIEGIPIPTYQPLSPEKPVDLNMELGNLRMENKLLETLKISSQGEDFSDGTGASAEDFNPDRDNKQPAESTPAAQLGTDSLANPMETTTTEIGEETILEERPSSEMGQIESEPIDKLELKTQEEEENRHTGGDSSLNELGSAGGSSSVLSDLLQDDVYFDKTSVVENEEDAIIEELLSPRRRRGHSSRDPDRREHEDISQEEEGSEELENEGAGELEESLSVSTNKPVRDESQYTIPASSPSAVERTDSYESAGSKSSSPIGGPSEEEEESLKLPEMLTNHSAVGLLPLFPSWSLLCLGHSSIYSHSHGLRDHPNFSHGSNYLLPLDFTLRVDLNLWQHKYDAMQTKRVPIPVRKPKKEDSTVTVKIFVGFEYECPRGHRYMLQTPSKLLKHSGPGGPKDSAAVIAKSDMPLWFPCTCRVSKPALMGQLMRLHVVTPKAPVLVSVLPRVQPSTAHPVIFHSGLSTNVALGPAQYWVLRFPFCYVSDLGCFYPPKDSTPSGRVMKGILNVVPDLN